MNSYKAYFDSQTISPEAEKRLLGLLNAAPKAKKASYLKPIAAMAACCAILAGLSLYGNRQQAPLPPQPDSQTDEQTENPPRTDGNEGGTHFFFMIPYIEYPLSQYDGLSVDTARMFIEDGSFWVDLSYEQIARLLGGEEEIPWSLGWEDFEVSGQALYDNQGALMEIDLSAESDGDWMTVYISPDSIPSDCIAHDWEAVTEVRSGLKDDSIKVSAYREEDENRTLYHSSYVRNGMGIRTVFCSFEKDPNLSNIFISMCAINPEGLMTNANIPDWASAKLTSFNEALEYSQFAPYLPEREPVRGWEFEGSYSYQEGVKNGISLYWSKGYDNIHISVALSEGKTEKRDTVDISNPSSYDARLYEIPWCDSVPEEYVLDFSSPTFRAEDMSLETVKARRVPHDTGEYSYDFKVLHTNGALVSYSFDGMTAEDIWAAIATSVK